MNEAETRAELIDPAIADAGWGKVDNSRVRREFQIAPGRLVGAGKRSKADIADYVLIYQGQQLAVVEAKKKSLSVTEGLAQAKRYAQKLKVRFAYSTNGVGIYRVDMETGKEGPVDNYPSPQDLWNETYAVANTWRERFAAIPFEDKGGSWEARYYQHNAIDAALEALTEGKDRILLNLATGTGKTFIAFQLAWKLFQSKWNAKDWRAGNEPQRRPRVLFLADRNILADQAYNSFGTFPDDALARISPSEIRKKGSVPKNANIFFTIFQTFMSGRDEEGNPAPYFGDYPKDFFDFIIIDECHRGGANDESTWRGIMEYFSSAVQLGLTATPRRKDNADTYAYFGEPVYTYSLKEGINDGFLTPFKVRQYATSVDNVTITSDDVVVQGEAEVGTTFTEKDFNKIVEIKEREQYRVQLFMDAIDQREKTIVFCATQAHALAVRDLINQIKTSTEPNYCVRVTAQDGEEGERWLRVFQDNEKSIPTILTTSQKLSTGVDARNVRNIVLLRPVNSMIEFKQIVGRGTRLFENKDYFTIYDFVKAYEHFNDPEWDGEPLPPEGGGTGGGTNECQVCGQKPCNCNGPTDPEPEPQPCPECGKTPCECEGQEKIVIELGDGKKRSLSNINVTTFWSPEGKPMTAHEFIQRLFGDLPELFKDEDELRALWAKPDTRKSLLEGLEEKGYGEEQLVEVRRIIDATSSDLFDVLAYIAFALPAMSRQERVDVSQAKIYQDKTLSQKEFLAFVLDHYIEQGVTELDPEKLPDLLELKYGSTADAVGVLGKAAEIRATFIGFQEYLYGKGVD